MTTEVAAIGWLFVAVQVLGLISALIARLATGSSRQTACYGAFLGCLTLVAGVTLVSPGLGLGPWLASSATLSLMILTVTCDFSRSAQRAVW